MKRKLHSILALAAGLASYSALAQGTGVQQDAPSAARVLAGVREYPEPVVEALVTLSQHPDWLDKAVKKIQANQDPAAVVDASTPEAVRGALKTLASLPEAIMLAGAQREELNVLRDLRQEAPQGADVKLRQLRTDFANARREAALRWQQALHGNEEALNAYRDLLTNFTEELRKQVPNFAAVEVTDRNYYLVRPPDEVVLGFAQEKKASEALWKLMTEWYDRYGTEPVDEQLLRGVGGIGPSQAQNALIDEPAERRKGMIRADDGQRGDSLGLIPIALQPLADQPAEARAAFAIAEHERLWARIPLAAAAGQDVASGAADGYDGADMTIEPPQEPQPGAAGADVVVTPARPDMIIPPAGKQRVTHDAPIVIASGYDDDWATQGGEVDTIEVVDGGTQVVVESAPTVVYEDYAPVYVTRPYYSYYPYYGGYTYPGWSFGFSFGYYGGYGCYPYSYYRGYHPYSYYGRGYCGTGYRGYYGYRSCGYATPYRGYGYGYRGYGGRGYVTPYNSGYRGYGGRGYATPYNGNYADGRGGRYGKSYSGTGDGRGYANNRGALGQGQRYANGSTMYRPERGSRDGRGDSAIGRGGSGIGRSGTGVTPRTGDRSGGSRSDGVVRRGGSGSSVGRGGTPSSIGRGGDGVRGTQPSLRSGTPRSTPRSGMQQAPSRSLSPRSSGPSRSSIGSLRGRSMQTSPAPRSSFNRSSVFRGGGSSRSAMPRGGGGGGGGARSAPRGGGGRR